VTYGIGGRMEKFGGVKKLEGTKTILLSELK